MKSLHEIIIMHYITLATHGTVLHCI